MLRWNALSAASAQGIKHQAASFSVRALAIRSRSSRIAVVVQVKVVSFASRAIPPEHQPRVYKSQCSEDQRDELRVGKRQRYAAKRPFKRAARGPGSDPKLPFKFLQSSPSLGPASFRFCICEAAVHGKQLSARSGRRLKTALRTRIRNNLAGPTLLRDGVTKQRKSDS